jgi:hypothetical protein
MLHSHIDAMFGNKRPQGDVWHTYAQVTVPQPAVTSNNNNKAEVEAIPTINVQYIMATNLTQPYSFVYNDFTTAVANTKSYSPNDRYIAFEYSSPSKLVLFTSSQPLSISSCAGVGERSPYWLWTASPLLSNGWTLLGESSKWLAVSSQRFTSLMANPSPSYAISVVVHGTNGEVVFLRFVDASSSSTDLAGGAWHQYNVECVFRSSSDLTARCTSSGVCICW